MAIPPSIILIFSLKDPELITIYVIYCMIIRPLSNNAFVFFRQHVIICRGVILVRVTKDLQGYNQQPI